MEFRRKGSPPACRQFGVDQVELTGRTYYKPGEVHREAMFTFKAAEPISKPLDPDGRVNMMQGLFRNRRSDAQPRQVEESR